MEDKEVSSAVEIMCILAGMPVGTFVSLIARDDFYYAGMRGDVASAIRQLHGKLFTYHAVSNKTMGNIVVVCRFS